MHVLQDHFLGLFACMRMSNANNANACDIKRVDRKTTTYFHPLWYGTIPSSYLPDHSLSRFLIVRGGIFQSPSFLSSKADALLQQMVAACYHSGTIPT